jgi:hypothetical protein
MPFVNIPFTPQKEKVGLSRMGGLGGEVQLPELYMWKEIDRHFLIMIYLRVALGDCRSVRAISRTESGYLSSNVKSDLYRIRAFVFRSIRHVCGICGLKTQDFCCNSTPPGAESNANFQQEARDCHFSKTIVLGLDDGGHRLECGFAAPCQGSLGRCHVEREFGELERRR